MKEKDDGPRRPGRPARPVTREHLLRVATEAFSELGYAGASMGDIAGRAGIRKSSLFHHFATKDELYGEVLSHVIQAIFEKVSGAQRPEEPLIKQIDDASASVQRFFGNNPLVARLLTREFVDGNTAVSVAGDAVHKVIVLVVDLIEAAIAQGLIPKQDSRQTALSILGVELMYFSLPSVSNRLMERNVFESQMIEERVESVQRHVRRLIGAPTA